MLEISGITLAGVVAGYIIGAFGAGVWNNLRTRCASIKLHSDSDHSTTPEIMVKLVPAVNGRLLELSTKKPHAHAPGHWEWEHEMFVIQEGQKLSEAISMAMLMKGLEK
jgi:hypothetical protein